MAGVCVCDLQYPIASLYLPASDRVLKDFLAAVQGVLLNCVCQFCLFGT